MNSGSHNIYKRRRAKLNLERDMKWNGPHDGEFFRCFEQYLDEAIKKFVQSQKISDVQADELGHGSNDSGLKPSASSSAYPGFAGKNFKILEATENKDDTNKIDSGLDLKND